MRRYVGERRGRLEGLDKATGRAQYAGDYHLENMLELALVRSTISHGTIRSIDTSNLPEDVMVFTVGENELSTDKTASFYDSVGVGSYPIDLHITTKSKSFFYRPTVPFTIPLGAMIPIKMKNLIPACKNIGTTHLTNGCYRLHPVEWNVGEVAGLLAAYSLDKHMELKEIRENQKELKEFQEYLSTAGIQLYW